MSEGSNVNHTCMYHNWCAYCTATDAPVHFRLRKFPLGHIWHGVPVLHVLYKCTRVQLGHASFIAGALSRDCPNCMRPTIHQKKRERWRADIFERQFKGARTFELSASSQNEPIVWTFVSCLVRIIHTDTALHHNTRDKRQNTCTCISWSCWKTGGAHGQFLALALKLAVNFGTGGKICRQFWRWRAILYW